LNEDAVEKNNPSEDAQSAEADAGLAARSAEGLAFVMDVPVEVTVEIGRKRVRIADILRLGAGSVLELDKASDEPLDIYVNDRPIARGEAVVVGDHYGVRVTEVLTVEEVRQRLRGIE
jgi:flagellar motor switch protein FliN/FliY